MEERRREPELAATGIAAPEAAVEADLAGHLDRAEVEAGRLGS